MRKLTAILVSTAAVLACSLVLLIDSESRVSSQSLPGGWINSSLSHRIIEELVGPEAEPANTASIDGGHCWQYTFRGKSTKNGISYPSQKQGCAVVTKYGVAAGNLFHEQGEKYAGYLEISGSNTFHPLSNSKNLVVIRNNGEIRIYRDFADLAQVSNVNGREMTYTLGAFDRVLDSVGTIIKSSTSVPQASKNGRWLVTYMGSKLIRIDLQKQNGDPYLFGDINGANRRAISDSGRYVAMFSIKNKNLALYDLNNCSDACSSVDLTAYLNQQVDGVQSIERIEFIDEHLLRLFVRQTEANTQSRTTQIILAPDGYSIPHTQGGYIAMGDSFASGEGDMDDSWYELGTNEPENKCHLSRRSYPYLLHQNLAFDEFHSVACSGAKIEHITISAQNSSQPTVSFSDIWLPGIVRQVEYIDKGKPKLITVSIGGNNVGFAGKLKECVVSPGTCDYAQNSEAKSRTAMEIASIFDELVDTYERVVAETEGQAKIYTVGYPQFITVAGDECGQNVHLNREERIFIASATKYLNQVVKAASQQAGVHYLDIEDSLSGFNLCSGADDEDMAFNGITFGDDEKLLPAWLFAPLDELLQLGKESFHPNQNGHKLIAQSIMGLTGNDLLNFNPCLNSENICPVDTPVPLPDSYWGEAASTFVNNLNNSSFIPVETIPKNKEIIIGSQVVNGGGQLSVYVEHLKPGASVIVEIHSTPTKLGTYQVNTQGVFDQSLQIPNGITPGFHNIIIYSQETAGDAIEYYQQILVLGPEGDIDNDGISDEEDSCGWVPASGIDDDIDGIDDACDGMISTPVSVEQGAPSQITESSDSTEQLNETEEATDNANSSTNPIVLAVSDTGSNPPQVVVNSADKELLGAVTDPTDIPGDPAYTWSWSSAMLLIGISGLLIGLSALLKQRYLNS